MFIVWGTKIVRKPLGRRADYCLLCRNYQPARMVRVNSVGHLYYIPLGRGTTQAMEQTCETCGFLQAFEFAGEYPEVSRDRHADVETLLADTNPYARMKWNKRAAWDNVIRSGSISPADRVAALSESFALANTLVQARTAEMRFDGLTGAGCLLTIVAFVGIGFGLEAVLKLKNDESLGIAAVVALVLGVITLILMAQDGRRYTKRAVLPILVRAIRPIRPTEEEIGQVLTDLRTEDMKLGKLLTVHQVLDAIQFMPQD